MTGLEKVARDFAETFEALGQPYAIMGGMAVRLYALPRPTYDVDFAAAAPRSELVLDDRLKQAFDTFKTGD